MIGIHINKGQEIRKLQGFDFEQLDGVTIDKSRIGQRKYLFQFC